MWRIDDPQSNEANKVKYDVVRYTRGRGLDLGCGPFKLYEHFTGVDNGHHWGNKGVDVMVDTCENLDLFASGSMDFVFSSHLLEHIENAEAALIEWMRVIKPGGHLVLYLPDENQYPKMGTEGANPDHKHDLNQKKVTAWMKRVGGWDLMLSEVRDNDNGPGKQGNEYSFLQVYRKRTDDKHTYPCQDDKPKKTVCIVRYGGFGDMLQACSIFPALKEAGYHITLCTTPQGLDVVKYDPHIDDFLIQDKNQVPNHELGKFWYETAKRYDRFINLSESVEASLLTLPERIPYGWPKGVRHAMMNASYLDMTHAIAEVCLPARSKFYPTEYETEQAKQRRHKMGEDSIVILAVMRGTSCHKYTMYYDQVFAKLLVTYPQVKIVTVGDASCTILEGGWEKEPRVIRRSGVWKIRETLAFAELVDVVVGPETGVLNSVALNKEVAKVVMLSHSSEQNLITHWENVIAIKPGENKVECFPCHKIHYSYDTCNPFTFDQQWCDAHNISVKGGLLEKGVKVAKCSAYVFPDMIFDAVEQAAGLNVKLVQEA